MKGRVVGMEDGEVLIESDDGTIYAVPVGNIIEMEIDHTVVLPYGCRIVPIEPDSVGCDHGECTEVLHHEDCSMARGHE